MKRFIYVLIIVITMFLSLTNVNASTTTYNREDKSNYGVNKKWKIDESNKSNVLNTPYVNADEKIYDFADILTDEEESLLYAKVKEFIDLTKMDMVFVTVDMSYYNDKVNEDYASDFYDYNDFGINTESYDGVLILRNVYSTDPYYNIYTFGKAQLYFPYERCERLLDNIYSDFSSHNYYTGYENAISNLTSFYNRGIPSSHKNYYIDDMGYMKKKYSFPFLIAFFVSIVVTTIVMSILVSKNKMIKLARKADVYLDSNSIGFSKRCDQFIGTNTVSHIISSSGGSGGGSSFSSSSGSSGGGHSGGGGRHG